ncbi:MAG: hypothetical protein WD049_05090 [Candidatus Paceibacterota bacterium]
MSTDTDTNTDTDSVVYVQIWEGPREAIATVSLYESLPELTDAAAGKDAKQALLNVLARLTGLEGSAALDSCEVSNSLVGGAERVEVRVAVCVGKFVGRAERAGERGEGAEHRNGVHHLIANAVYEALMEACEQSCAAKVCSKDGDEAVCAPSAPRAPTAA